jgi:hypothetical protein
MRSFAPLTAYTKLPDAMEVLITDMVEAGPLPSNPYMQLLAVH